MREDRESRDASTGSKAFMNALFRVRHPFDQSLKGDVSLALRFEVKLQRSGYRLTVDSPDHTLDEDFVLIHSNERT